MSTFFYILTTQKYKRQTKYLRLFCCCYIFYLKNWKMRKKETSFSTCVRTMTVIHSLCIKKYIMLCIFSKIKSVRRVRDILYIENDDNLLANYKMVLIFHEIVNWMFVLCFICYACIMSKCVRMLLPIFYDGVFYTFCISYL